MLQESPGETLTAILDHPDRPALVVPEDGQVTHDVHYTPR